MPSSLLSRILAPRFPAAAVGISSGSATAVHLERGRGAFTLRRAATIALPDSLVRPAFDERNIMDQNELADALAELVTSAGLARQRKWSIALPEAATRTIVIGLEAAIASRRELEDVLRWKMERGFGLPPDELRVARERLTPDARGNARYIATAVRTSVLDEYESVFMALGWRAGLILPCHMGEERWLTRDRAHGDALLVSSHAEGFTAVLLRNQQPLIVRSVMCEQEYRADELYRLLLFYRDRLASTTATEAPGIDRLLVVGDDFSGDSVSDIVAETLGLKLPALRAEDVGLALPTGDLSFDIIVAPAGLATLAWS